MNTTYGFSLVKRNVLPESNNNRNDRVTFHVKSRFFRTYIIINIIERTIPQRVFTYLRNPYKISTRGGRLDKQGK